MRRWSVFFLLVLSTGAGSGCENLRSISVNLTEVPLDQLNHQIENDLDRRQAEAAWNDYIRAHGGEEFTIDFAQGYVEGYSDYLDEGGRGLPPALPPWHYRTPEYETVEGHQAIEAWYAGFREGAAAAKLSGGRNRIVLPNADGPLQEPHAYVLPLSPNPAGSPGAPGTPPVEILPAPRKQMPPADADTVNGHNAAVSAVKDGPKPPLGPGLLPPPSSSLGIR